MADDDDWFGGSDEPEPEEPKSLFKKKAATPPPAKAEEAAPAEAAAAAAAAPEVAEPEGEYLDPDKLLLFKHWIRPKFLPYKYLTEYRKNYYDDVIDYLDKRTKGIGRDVPVAQTWAERALRSYTRNKRGRSDIWSRVQPRSWVEQKVKKGLFQINHSRNFIYSRPKFLQYKYLYDYQQNYYNDVMEVVDRRRKGFRRAIPKPQTWAERILRSRNDPLHKLETFDRYLEDLKLVTRSEISGTFYSYYSKESVNKRFSKLLF